LFVDGYITNCKDLFASLSAKAGFVNGNFKIPFGYIVKAAQTLELKI
jgi:hypothetical protein